VQAVGQVVSTEKLQALQTKLEQTKAVLETQDSAQIAALTRKDILGDMFYAGTLGYYAQLIALGHIAALTQRANANLSAGYGTLGYEPKVNYFFGFPTSIEAGGVVLDIPWSMVSHVSDGDMEKRKQYNLQWGMIGSALEHAVPEQMFQDPNEPKLEATSAVKALQMASAEGQRTYQITQVNMDTALPNIHHDGKSEIQAALQAGMTAITHTDSVSVHGWTGAGYIILDSEDNTGAYKISGGLDGGLAYVKAVGFNLGILLGFSIFSLGVGVTMGSAVLPAMAAFFGIIASTVMILYTAYSVFYDERYPACFLKGLAYGVVIGSFAGTLAALLKKVSKLGALSSALVHLITSFARMELADVSSVNCPV
jgi:hypothetical protein